MNNITEAVEEFKKEFHKPLSSDAVQLYNLADTRNVYFDITDMTDWLTKTLQDIDKKAREEALDSLEHRTTKCECCNGFEERFNSLKEDKEVTAGEWCSACGQILEDKEV